MIERTTDTAFISSVINRPGIREDLTDGEELQIPMHESIYYLKPMLEQHSDGAIEDVAVGILGFVQVNAVTWNPHIAILPEYRGHGTEAMKSGVEWMFKNTPCRKVVAYPPAFKARMIRVFEKCGFKVEGVSPKSFSWHGVLRDRVLMGIEKE